MCNIATAVGVVVGVVVEVAVGVVVEVVVAVVVGVAVGVAVVFAVVVGVAVGVELKEYLAMSKSVVEGVLKSISPSSINKFDASAPFGCQRRWWYRYVQGLPEPQSGNQALGEQLHALIEARLTKATLGMEVPPDSEAHGLYLAGETMIEDVAKRRILSVEASVLGYSLAGVSVVGYCDVVTEDGIIDWKTSSDIRRYGKTAADLSTDTQMVMYARAFHADLPSVKLAHGQFETKGNKRSNFVEVEVSQEALASHERNVTIPLVEEMKKAAALDDVSKLPRNQKSCFNCAYRAHCPNEEGNTVMSFFKKIAESKPAAPAAEEVAPVVPPDAPKSDPALAAKPVENFEAVPPPKERKMKYVDEVPPPEVTAPATPPPTPPAPPPPASPPPEEPKRGRGRPKGSKNKTTEAATPVVAEAIAEQNSAPLVIKSVTVSKGYTVNLGSFNSVRFDVSVTAESNDLEAAYVALMGEVESRLAAEAAKFEAEVDQKNRTMKPANEVVLK